MKTPEPDEEQPVLGKETELDVPVELTLGSLHP